MRHLIRFVVAVVSISIVGCTTLNPLPIATGLPQEPLGQMVRIGKPDGSHTNLKVVELRDGGFIGTHSAGRGASQRVEVRYSELTSLELVEFSPWKTAGMFAIVLGIVSAIALSGSYGYTFAY